MLISVRFAQKSFAETWNYRLNSNRIFEDTALNSLQKHQADWRVHDLLIDGGSMVTNFRTQFDRVIRQESYAELVQRLEHSALSVDKAN